MSNFLKNNHLDIPQDLHIHTVFSKGDGAIVSQQTIEFIASLHHANIVGISDHYEYLDNEEDFNLYKKTVKANGLHLGTEINGGEWAAKAAKKEFEYFVYHCRNREQDYEGLDILLSTGKPVIIAHPLFLGTDLNRVPAKSFVEINNRYIWRANWKEGFKDFTHKFNFVMSSDAHQPNWLNQNIARTVADELGIKETLLF
ncbi:MAG: hypothetical protein Q8907_03070 [Bacteroidota bacterium]|nr:hypothetical protein [Bacteroidota bacterium]MDP4273242.1 hypothetical protein [Bacteroidota bacterium]